MKRAPSGGAPVPGILAFLDAAYPDARILLDFRNPFELLVATVLSAQCTDDRVNQVTPALFAKWPDAAKLAAATQEAVEDAVRSTGFYRNKAKAIRELAAALLSRHAGNVPGDLAALTGLPGVGRKTASVVLGGCFGVPSLPVDTHVARVSFRLGLTASKDPERIEQDLAAAIPEDRWWEFTTRLGWHGRRVCVARKPRCEACGLDSLCPKNGVVRT
ncbi:MAG TPA: endonuclease III [Candidatus Deferrimicrobiaceae bacterium]